MGHCSGTLVGYDPPQLPAGVDVRCAAWSSWSGAACGLRGSPELLGRLRQHAVEEALESGSEGRGGGRPPAEQEDVIEDVLEDFDSYRALRHVNSVQASGGSSVGLHPDEHSSSETILTPQSALADDFTRASATSTSVAGLEQTRYRNLSLFDDLSNPDDTEEREGGLPDFLGADQDSVAFDRGFEDEAGQEALAGRHRQQLRHPLDVQGVLAARQGYAVRQRTWAHPDATDRRVFESVWARGIYNRHDSADSIDSFESFESIRDTFDTVDMRYRQERRIAARSALMVQQLLREQMALLPTWRYTGSSNGAFGTSASSLDNLGGDTSLSTVATFSEWPKIVSESDKGCKGGCDCAICQNDYYLGDEVKGLPCFHTFHAECIDKWLTGGMPSAQNCPICMSRVFSSGQGA